MRYQQTLPTTVYLRSSEMPALNLFIASTNFSNADTTWSALNQFVADRSLVWDLVQTHRNEFAALATKYWHDAMTWLLKSRR